MNKTPFSEATLQRIARMRLMDDIFMQVTFRMFPECVQEVLRVIMDKPDLLVVEVRTQEKLPSIAGRSFCLDVLAKDAQGKYYEIEIQRKDDGAHPCRAASHASAAEMALASKGQAAKDAPQLYVIFITEGDVLGDGLPIYHVERTIMETGRLFGDGVHIIYVNGAVQGDATPLARLMHDLQCADPGAIFNPTLAHAVRHIKTSEEGAKKMGRMSEEIWNEGRAEGEAKGRAEGKAEGLLEGSRRAARQMLAMGGFALEKIAAITSLSEDEVRQLAAAQAY